MAYDQQRLGPHSEHKKLKKKEQSVSYYLQYSQECTYLYNAFPTWNGEATKPLLVGLTQTTEKKQKNIFFNQASVNLHPLLSCVY